LNKILEAYHATRLA